MCACKEAAVAAEVIRRSSSSIPNEFEQQEGRLTALQYILGIREAVLTASLIRWVTFNQIEQTLALYSSEFRLQNEFLL